MIEVAEAMQRIREAMPEPATDSVAIADACGRVLAQDVTAERDQPPFDRVMMDGIAINHEASKGGQTRFLLAGTQAAGAPRLALPDPASCIEVMTGTELPELADCIVPVEQIRLSADHAELRRSTTPRQWQFIHRAGSDYAADDTLLVRGTMIRAPEMAVLASAGPAHVSVAQRPSIMIFAVGDELSDPGQDLGPAQIRRSNDFAIDALFRGFGLDRNMRDKLPDNPEVLRKAIDHALNQHDIIVLTGGVSMGKYDYIPSIMNELGVNILLHKVAQKPGKPMWVGHRGSKMVFALPGNPVSSLVCARRFVIPAIHGAMGYAAPAETTRLGRAIGHKISLAWFVPVTLHTDASGMIAEPRMTNTSGDFHSLAGTSGFVELPAGPAEIAAGHIAPLWRW